MALTALPNSAKVSRAELESISTPANAIFSILVARVILGLLALKLLAVSHE